MKKLSFLLLACISISGLAQLSLISTQPDGTGTYIGIQGDQFGCAVAVSEQYAIVGARENDEADANAGRVMLYERTPDSWEEVASLVDPNGAAHDFLGYSVEIQGERAVAGAYAKDTLGLLNVGAVLVFDRWDGIWQHAQTLRPSDPQEYLSMGLDCAVWGEWVFGGAYGDDTEGDYSGAVYAFHETENGWEEQKIIPDDSDWFQHFGRYVEVNDNGLFITAEQDSELAFDGGAVYHYVLSGDEWVFNAKILPSDPMASQQFGDDIAVFGDLLVVGAPGDSNGSESTGAAYLFEWNGATWQELDKFTPPSDDVKSMGYSIAIQEERIAVSSTRLSTPGKGDVHVYAWTSTGWEFWQTINEDTGTDPDEYGFGLDMTDGQLAVGAFNVDNAGISSGQTFFYEISIPLGVGDVLGAASLLVSPNPAAADQAIHFSVPVFEGVVLDMGGREVLSLAVDHHSTTQLKLEGLASGMYTVHARTSSGWSTAKLVVR